MPVLSASVEPWVPTDAMSQVALEHKRGLSIPRDVNTLEVKCELDGGISPSNKQMKNN